jgi:hypothetical protein
MLLRGRARAPWRGSWAFHRDTIHRWIRDGELDRDLDSEPVHYGPRPPVPTKLDAYKPIIDARLTAYPELSVVRRLDEIRAAGYMRAAARS